MRSVTALLALILLAGCGPGPKLEEAWHVNATIERSIAVLRANRGSLCGTPALWARNEIIALGKAAVPRLIADVETPSFADVRTELTECLRAITCGAGPSSAAFSLDEFKVWWDEHGSESRDEWVLARMEASGMFALNGSSCELELTDPSVVARLESWLSSSRRELRQYARSVLWTRLRSPAVLVQARANLSKGDLETRNDVLNDIDSLHLVDLVPELLEVLRSDPALAESAARTAAHLQVQEAVPLIAAAESTSSGLTRCRLLRCLQELSPDAAEPRLRTLLASPLADERECAFDDLFGSSAPWAHAAMIAALDDPSPRVVSKAAAAVTAAKDMDEATRLAAASKLLELAVPTDSALDGMPAFFVDAALWTLALRSGWPPEEAPHSDRFTEANLASLRDWWTSRLARSPGSPPGP